MPRIRSIHPGQWTDENFVEASAFGRLLAIGLRNESDDNGIFEWKPKTLKMRLLPADNLDLEELLEELMQCNQIMRYEVEGKAYGMVRNFLKFQRPEKPTFLYPVPDVLLEGYRIHPKFVEEQAAKAANTPVKSPSGSGDIGDNSPNGRRAIGEQSTKSKAEGIGIVKEEGIVKKEATASSFPTDTHTQKMRAQKISLQDLCVDQLRDWLQEMADRGKPITVEVELALEQMKAHYGSTGGKDKNGRLVEDWVEKAKYWLMSEQTVFQNRSRQSSRSRKIISGAAFIDLKQRSEKGEYLSADERAAMYAYRQAELGIHLKSQEEPPAKVIPINKQSKSGITEEERQQVHEGFDNLLNDLKKDKA